MKILNLLATGKSGGIETLCNNIDKYSKEDNYWIFLFKSGEIAKEMINRKPKKSSFLGFNKLNIIKYIYTINKVIKKNNIEIVTIHHGGTYCNLIYYILKKLNKNVKFIRFLHSCYEKEFSLKHKYIQDKIYILFLNKALQCSDLIISVSKAVQESYEEKFNIESKNKVVVYNGIDKVFLEKKQPDREYLEHKDIKIIYVGRLVKEKGVDILINAISIISKKEKRIKLTIVGDGNEKENLQNLVNKLKLNKFIKFEGVQKKVIEWLDKSDLFIYPSIWKEAFGISVVEAMARGCIPIVFNKGGLPEIIENEKNGFLVNEITANMLAKEINNVIQIKQRNNIIDNAIKTANKFSIENTIIKLTEEYKKLIEEEKYEN